MTSHWDAKVETPVFQLFMFAYYTCFSFIRSDAGCVVSAHIWCGFAHLMLALNYLLHVIAYIGESVSRRNQWQLKKMNLLWQLNWPLTFEIRVPAAVSVSTVFSRGYVLITCRKTRRTSPKHSWTAGLLHGSSFTAETWENILIQSFRETSGSIWTWEFVYCFKQMTCFLYFFIKCNAFISV